MHHSSTAFLGLVVAALAAPSALQAAQELPLMGGGYGDSDVIAIPVIDPEVTAIAGALFKPAGAGPFPAVIYMSGCGGLGAASEAAQEKLVIDHYLAQGVATLIVDPFTARHEVKGVCDQIGEIGVLFYRGGLDFHAARDVLKGMTDIDQAHVFLQGYSYGAVSAAVAVDGKYPISMDINVAGAIEYYPYCVPWTVYSVPTLVLIGGNDDWTPASSCEALTGRPNFEVTVYPGATHAFTTPFPEPVDFAGHHMAYDEAATQAAQARADAFIAAHRK